MANRFGDEQHDAEAPLEVNRFGDPVYSTTVTDAYEQPKGSAVSRFFGGVGHQVKEAAVGLGKLAINATPIGAGIDAFKALSAMKEGKAPPTPELIQMAHNVAMAHATQAQKAMKSFQDGQYSEGAGHLLATILPFVGPAAADIGENMAGTDPVLDKYGNVVKQGKAPDIAGGVGEGIGLIGTMAAPEAAGKILSKAKDIPVVPKLGNRNPTEAAALDYLDQAGVPVSAGVRTGNAFVRGTEKLADHTPLGSVVAAQSERAATEGLKTEAGRLVERAKPDVPSAKGYGEFEKAAENRRTWRDVPTGTYEDPNNPGVFLPKSERMPMPVRIGDLRDQMGKIVDDFSLASGIARNETAAYSVAKKFAEGDEFVPAPTAEKALSALKELARSGEGVGAGTAKMLIPKLQEMIDGSVKKYAGPDVMKSLQTARQSAAAEFGVKWLENAFNKAEAEGGFGRAQGLWADWQRLSQADKTRIFRHPELAADVDKFLLGAKKLAENPNPSGSGYIAAIAGQAAFAVTNPATGIPYVLLSGALAKMLHSPAASRALTNGVRISLDQTAPAAAKAAAAANILRMAGDLAQPLDQTKAAESNDPSRQTGIPATILPPQ
jgi:hypothetical protein